MWYDHEILESVRKIEANVTRQTAAVVKLDTDLGPLVELVPLVTRIDATLTSIEATLVQILDRLPPKPPPLPGPVVGLDTTFVPNP